MKLIENWWSRLWRAWSVRIQAVAAMLTGWMWFDPSSLLWAVNMIPGPVRAVLPHNTLLAVGAVAFLLNLGAILARPIRQKNMERFDGPV